MPSKATISLQWPEPDIALLTLDMPDKGANVLSSSVLEEFAGHLDTVESRDDVAGLIIASAKPGIFIAGADLREFLTQLGAAKGEIVATSRRGQKLFSRLAAGKFVTVAAISGVCLGGGAELAVWCDRRIAAIGAAEIGFPEVKLGMFPGWGGTARTPRIVGLANAVELVTTGDSLDANDAYQMGLCDDLAAADDLVNAAIRMVRQERQSGQYLRDRERSAGRLPVNSTELAFLGATFSAVIQAETKGQYPAPMAALELMIEASGDSLEEACQREAEQFAGLFGGAVNRALINVFFLTDGNKRDRGVADDVQPRPLASVGVIGAGIMGAGIAAANIKRQVPVVLADASEEARAAGARNVIEEASYNRKTRSTDAARAVELTPLLNLGDDSELAHCDLIVEAIVENAGAKKQVYARIEPQMRPDAVLASNTSTIPIAELSADLQHPERFCGIHFFNPVRRMKLVEVIRGPQTSEQTVATAVAYAKRVGKMPIVVNDGPGFLVNRLLFPYMNEALQLLTEGVPMKVIDRASTRFGMPMGPIALYDMVGLDTALLAGRTMWEAFPDRIAALPILPALVKQGRLGPKSGLGFYSYQNKRRRAEEDPAVAKLLEVYIQKGADVSPETLTHRLFLPMLLEATRVLEEKLVRSVRDVDLGLIFGLGFPAFRGGLLFWADTVGAAGLLEMLKPLEALGTRFQPTPLLLKMAAEGQTFYGLDY